MNYFNYFTEIEDTFVRRRGKHVLLSPLDWALIEGWKDMGVPLHVALRGIEHAFDSHDAKPRRRSVKTLFYCQEEVEAQYAEWLESQVGAGDGGDAGGQVGEHQEGAGDGSAGRAGTNRAGDEGDARLPFPRAVILEHLARARAALQSACGESDVRGGDDFGETLERVVARLTELEADFAGAARPDAERLEEALADLERMLDDGLRAGLDAEESAAIRAGVEAQLQPYRARMERAVYEQTFDNLLLKQLRDARSLPRLSLFYL